MKINIEIDRSAGFCSGVRRAIRLACDELKNGGELFCLGQIVHNEAEVARLESRGMKTISREELKKLHNVSVLLRAHGEPPETYTIAKKNNIRLIDGTCPTVLKLQACIKDCFKQHSDAQIAIFGQGKHPEVIGLNGQTNFNAVILEGVKDIKKLNFARPVFLFAQTTQNKTEYRELIDTIREQKRDFDNGQNFHFTAADSICKQVANREENLRQFARDNDVVLFAGGNHSSNGKYLFSICRKENPNSYYISNTDLIEQKWFDDAERIGISGATSTPGWLLEKIALKIRDIIKPKIS
jgi:4-hydroxy-3-methylbut-2-en-1-yl diphosphate reductase